MSVSSQAREALISVRLVVADHYMADPVPGLDPLVSAFSGSNIKRVPVIRVFGSTLSGQRACLHLHGIFPYIYVPMPDNEKDGWVYRLSASLDKAINISMGQSNAKVQHVYKAVKVSGVPMYGYHPRQHTFVKIYFYNPHLGKRAAELLQGGAVMDRLLQPHESHTNYVLQFMMDYNLQGMNTINLSHALFRRGKLHDEYDDMEPIFEPPWKAKRRNCSLDSSRLSTASEPDPDSVKSSYMRVAPEQRYFQPDEMEECLKLPAEVTRMSTSELELDAVAADIINHQDVTGAAMNPGLVALWEDERLRRKKVGMSDPLSPPPSPPRPEAAADKSESEKFWYERLSKVIEDKMMNETLNDSPDASDPEATINIPKKISRPHVYAAETPELEVSQLPEATQLDAHIQSLSDTILNATASASFVNTSMSENSSKYADETIVDEEFILSQVGSVDSESEEEDVDDELVGLLADLATEAQENKAEENGERCKPNTDQDDDIFKTPKSQKTQSQSQPSGRKKKSLIREPEKEKVDSESLGISQIIWDKEDDEDIFKTPKSQRSQQRPESVTKKKLSRVLEEEEERETLEMSQVVWDTDHDHPGDDNWDSLDKTLMETFAKNLTPTKNCDIEDLITETDSDSN